MERKAQCEEIEYTLTMNSRQAKECLKAVELLMRMKINQPEEISRAVLDGMYERIGIDEYIRRKNGANEYLRAAFAAIFPTWDEVQKDDEWYVLYNIYQAIRYQIHLAEHPGSTGVDSYPPMQFTDEPIPKCEYRKMKND